MWAVSWKRSIVRGTNGSMLAVASRSIACFALLEYGFAVEDGSRLSGDRKNELRFYGSG